MRNKVVASLVTIGVLATSNAFASRARNLVLGSNDPLGIAGGRGSLFYDINDNIFYNPSYVNDFKNWATIEKSTGVNTSSTPASVAGRAEGGFVSNFGNFNLGGYMNRGTAVTGNYTNGAIYNTTNMRPLEVFFGSDMGVKWGLGLNYASFRNVSGTTRNTDTNLVVKAGAQVQDFEPFADYKVIGTNKTRTAGTVKNKEFGFGARYHYGEWTPYAAYRNRKYDGSTTLSAWTLGFGRSTKVNEGVKLNYGVSFARNNKGDATVANGGSVGNHTVVPFDISVEGDATGWLSLRAGLSYRFVDQAEGVTQADTTTGRIGASIHVGKLSFDWAVGKEGSLSANETTGIDGQTFDIGSGFFTAAALTYNW